MSHLHKLNKFGSARSQIGIKEVKDGVLVLPDGRHCSILATSSVNFELQSEDEQDALIDNFQSFLNSLTTPIQILIRVRELDIDRYLETFQTHRELEKIEVYKEQLDNYNRFIKKLVSGNKILSRRFYVVIPLADLGETDFKHLKERLTMETEIVIKGLEKMGMNAHPLTSLEILELFYSFYRPDQAKSQPLAASLLTESDVAI